MNFGENAQVVFRLLCPSSRAGSVIGKGGEVIQEFRQMSQAKIKVEPAVPNSEEREILISSSNIEGGRSPAEIALSLIIERVYEEEGEPEGICTLRMLISHNQVGPLLGKQGTVVSELRAASGANIRVLNKDQLPSCAMPNDEVLQIAGEWSNVKYALQLIARNLKEHPPQSTPLSFVSSPSIMMNAPTIITGQLVETTYRLLVPHNKIGSIIGKGGEMIKQIRHETGAKVKIFENSDNNSERVLCATSVEDGGTVTCAAGEAILKCVVQIMNDATRIDSDVRSHTIRLLVPTSQAGAVIGKEGQTVREMIKETGANVRFFQGDELPQCSEEDDELLQIDGATIPCLQALQHCLARLRQNMARAQRMQQSVVAPMTTAPVQVTAQPPTVMVHAHARTPVTVSSPFVLPPEQYEHQYQVSPSPVGPIISGGYFQPQFVPVEYPQSSLVVQLTQQQTGKLIGPHGKHINHIRQVCSGAKIYLRQSEESQERALEVSGNIMQVHQCTQLVMSYLLGGAQPMQ
eukprot:TRINITY_DN2190_c0_g2_i1.p1 TRINITY_DN2190_c0_g2~~TRINITY_DN2190_c0_g2_i1.p1  ORF type:complete len:519 (+),score=60.46 TRINITY_DN2190_c0_g2_i1:139-1695(+)